MKHTSGDLTVLSSVCDVSRKKGLVCGGDASDVSMTDSVHKRNETKKRNESLEGNIDTNVLQKKKERRINE